MKRLFLFVFLVVATIPCAFAAPSAPSTDEAVSASKTWLAMIDSANYADSWKRHTGQIEIEK